MRKACEFWPWNPDRSNTLRMLGYIVMLRAWMFRSLIVRTGIKERNITIYNHWHVLIWTACCNTCWLKACVANWSWRIWEWLLMGYNADHTHLSANMLHDLHSLLWIAVGRCCWSDFVYFKVTQYINPSKPSSRYFRWKCWSFYCLYFR